GGLVPQVTGFVDPRLQLLGNTFLPANLSAPYAPSGAPQFAQQPQQAGQNLQQSIQQHNQSQRGSSNARVPWAITKAEKKQYDNIFRAWDAKGTGFINGDTALQVFGQSGLDKNDLARIWSLADRDDRGKLAIDEFHVAMGLIYRRLNGAEIPNELPQEMVPDSWKSLSEEVDRLSHYLKSETRSGNIGSVDDPVSRLPSRTLTGTRSEYAGTRKDGTIYKHNEDEITGYKPPGRHINRNDVRTGREGPTADIDQLRRQLEQASRTLDDSSAEAASRTAEDEALDREMEDLKRKVKRVQEDL
ncbi:hypothetical protein M422DRAFT_265756, partial [Sphaerobolus stellatus SS14]